MKALKEEFKMWLAEKFLEWAVGVSPKTRQGAMLREAVSDYTLDCIAYIRRN